VAKDFDEARERDKFGSDHNNFDFRLFLVCPSIFLNAFKFFLLAFVVLKVF
jgi:hypothetical protein